MKKSICRWLLCLLLVSSTGYSQSLDEMQQDFDRAVGVCASDGMATALGASMMGWGLAIVIGISILSIVLHQSSTMHSPIKTKGGTGNKTGVGSLL